LAKGRLHSSEQINKLHGPIDGKRALCGQIGSVSHIFSTCALAKFPGVLGALFDVQGNLLRFMSLSAVKSSSAWDKMDDLAPFRCPGL
jgi:hypothetical protein